MAVTLLTDPNRPCWFVGAAYGGTDDQSPRFLRDGIWENGWGVDGDHRSFEQVNSMRPGDRIAIKSSYRRKNNIPFDNQGRYVSTMAIKAVGTITKNLNDGCRVEVDWTPVIPQREWYFYTTRRTIWEVWPGKGTIPWAADALIGFAFENKSQDYAKFLNEWGWLNDTPPVYDSSAPEFNEPIPDIPADPYSLDDIMADGCFLSRAQLQDIIEHWQSKKNLILQGPPGTGKTWLARKLAYALIDQKDETRVQAVQFHPNLSYEDFVRGHRPVGDGKLALVDGPFLNMVAAARQDPDSDYVIVIEEINRGNPAQVFGEMLTLLESDKRKDGEALSLSYPKSPEERVHIPPNLYIIGTMNIADRSLALVDLAFRRRFAFEELEPQFTRTWLEWVDDNCGIAPEFLADIQRKLEALNRQIADDRTLGRQFRIGHSYFTPSSDQSIRNAPDWFRRIVQKEIAPLLDEYWFDSPEKAQDAKDALLEGLGG